MYIQHHRQADDLRARFKVTEWGVFYHSARLRNHPARLKLVLSASARRNALQERATKYCWDKQ